MTPDDDRVPTDQYPVLPTLQPRKKRLTEAVGGNLARQPVTIGLLIMLLPVLGTVLGNAMSISGSVEQARSEVRVLETKLQNHLTSSDAHGLKERELRTMQELQTQIAQLQAQTARLTRDILRCMRDKKQCTEPKD